MSKSCPYCGLTAQERYSEWLRDERWLFTARQIKQRDRERCVDCGETEPLEVHHLYYIAGRRPWEYPHFALVTLCSDCHEARHAVDPQEWELAIAFFLSRGPNDAAALADVILRFCKDTGLKPEQLFTAFTWLLKKPGTLIPLIHEAENPLCQCPIV